MADGDEWPYCSKCHYDTHECPGCGDGISHAVDEARGCCSKCFRELSENGHSKHIRPCACGHTAEWHTVEHPEHPELLLDSSCQVEQCPCNGYVDCRSSDTDHVCSCTGEDEDGHKLGCCTGHVRGCTCDVDWEELYGG